RDKPEPATTAPTRGRRPEGAAEAPPTQPPSQRPRAAIGSEPKPGEEQKPAPRRHPGAAPGEAGRPVAARPAEGAPEIMRPEGDQNARPAAPAESRPAMRRPPAATAVRREPEKPAVAPPGADDRLKSYMSSGEEAKEAKTDEPQRAPTDSDR